MRSWPEIFDDQCDDVSTLVIRSYGIVNLICARAKIARIERDPSLIKELTNCIDRATKQIYALLECDKRSFSKNLGCVIYRDLEKFQNFFKEKDKDIPSYRIQDLSVLASERYFINKNRIKFTKKDMTEDELIKLSCEESWETIDKDRRYFYF